MGREDLLLLTPPGMRAAATAAALECREEGKAAAAALGERLRREGRWKEGVGGRGGGLKGNLGLPPASTLLLLLLLLFFPWGVVFLLGDRERALSLSRSLRSREALVRASRKERRLTPAALARVSISAKAAVSTGSWGGGDTYLLPAPPNTRPLLLLLNSPSSTPIMPP